MALAQVVRNPDDTYTVTLTAKAQRVLNRWSNDAPAVSKAKRLEETINGFLQNKLNDQRGADGPVFVDKYDALDATQKANVDAILATAVVGP